VPVPTVCATDLGLRLAELGSDEVILKHWTAPGGRGLLTNRRCLLLSLSHPVRRTIQWAQILEHVDSIEVEQDAESASLSAIGVGTSGPVCSQHSGGFRVTLDNATVFRGPPGECETIQGWIDTARAIRRSELGLDSNAPENSP
jgi:hypothetical protein